MRTLLLALAALPALACTQQDPCRVTFNYATDLLGNLDQRQYTWGRAEAFTWKVPISKPNGVRVRIVQVSGDLVSWVRDAVAETVKTGVLLGFQTTAPDGTKLCADPRLCADNTFLYVQDGISGNAVARAPFTEKYPGRGVQLERDAVFLVKVASWLNDTGRAVHLEVTATVFYYFEHEEDCVIARTDGTFFRGRCFQAAH